MLDAHDAYHYPVNTRDHVQGGPGHSEHGSLVDQRSAGIPYVHGAEHPPLSLVEDHREPFP